MTYLNKRKKSALDDYHDFIGDVNDDNYQFLFDLIFKLIPRSSESFSQSFLHHIKDTLNQSENIIDDQLAYTAISYSIRDRLIQLFNITMMYFISSKAKQLYYVSSEFLIGRFLQNALLNLQLEDIVRQSLIKFGIELDDVYEEEHDPGPGSSGIGRFAACLLDSFATLNYPAWGYGLFYSNGYFKQIFNEEGKQEVSDESFLNYIEPWRIKRPNISYKIYYGGNYNYETHKWINKKVIKAVANDFLIPGYHTINTNCLRLWSSTNDNQQNDSDDLSNLTEKIYSSDSNDPQIIRKRLLQEYFLASATVQDILNRFQNEQNGQIRDLPRYAAIHLNGTHASLMPIELLRILIDDEKIGFNDAISIVQQTFSFTCHSIIPITFERWMVPLFEELIPRHLHIIYDLNLWYLNTSNGNKTELSIIEENNPKLIRMINLSIICSHTVNGVSDSQTKILTDDHLRVFSEKNPDQFLNITNGVSIRKWVHHCNRSLSKLITESLDGNTFWPIFNSAKEENIFHPQIDSSRKRSNVTQNQNLFEEEETENDNTNNYYENANNFNNRSSSDEDNNNRSRKRHTNNYNSDDDINDNISRNKHKKRQKSNYNNNNSSDDDNSRNKNQSRKKNQSTNYSNNTSSDDENNSDNQNQNYQINNTSSDDDRSNRNNKNKRNQINNTSSDDENNSDNQNQNYQINNTSSDDDSNNQNMFKKKSTIKRNRKYQSNSTSSDDDRSNRNNKKKHNQSNSTSSDDDRSNHNNKKKRNQSSDDNDAQNNTPKNNGYEIDLVQKNNDFNKTPQMLHSLSADSDFIDRFTSIKYQNKVKLSNFVESVCGIDLEPDFMLFDVFAKEFKHHHRQSLHIFSIIHRYLNLVKMKEEDRPMMQPRAFIIAGKASPASTYLQSLVTLINNVAKVVNDDDTLHNFLRVAFIPNYNVSIAEVLVGGADVNVQISTPCMEAAATSNMKFALNGSLIIGTRDNTNIEIADQIGEENVFFFGMPSVALDDARSGPIEDGKVHIDSKLRDVFDAIRNDLFGDHEQYEEIIRYVENNDYDLISVDFDEYLRLQEQIDLVFLNEIENGKKIELRRVAAIPHMEKFSSDRAVVEYAEKVWNIKQYPVPIKYVSDDEDEI